jgi:triosephosphate isomerase
MKYVIANWKMTMDLALVGEWFETYKKAQNQLGISFKKTLPIIAPSFVHIPYAFLETESIKEVKLASQDISHYEKGSHTGESGAFQIKDFCKYCIIGHSERRDSTEIVLRKRDLAMREGLTPIMCFVSLEEALKYYLPGIILAWEDPAFISGGGQYKEKPIDEVQKAIEKLRKSLPKEAVLLYGGSVNKVNISDLACLDLLDGVLVGQASLDPMHFLEIIKAYEISRSEE